MKKWYKYDLQRFILLQLPSMLRRFKLFLYIYFLLKPLEWLMGDVLYRMQHTGQVMYLEKVLNEYFEIAGYDPDLHEQTKVIIIGPGEIPEELYIFLSTEPQEPLWLDVGDVWLLTGQEMMGEYCDFTVLVPQSLQNREIEIRSRVDYYKLAGKQYKIIYI